MKELNEEIKLTLNLMQTDIDDGAHDELQWHLNRLREMKRTELQQRLTERSWLGGKAPYKSKPLTAEELKAGGWWLDGSGSQSLLELFREYGVNITGVSSGWFDASVGVTCVISSSDFGSDLSKFKQLKRIGNDFYWSRP